jgi:chromatin segregation and condensation protein Rec8/ScpA/Scc1 (kleisin family)
MLSDQDMISLMVNEPSWEDVIVRIVAEEKMDPWDIDICRLANVFLDYIQKINDTDLSVPARFILISAILLRMKSDVLEKKKKRLLSSMGEKPEPAWYKVLAKLPPLAPPIKRMPVGSVSIDELMHALKKAFDVKDRRKKRKERRRRVIANAMPLEPKEDITHRISRLYDEIQLIITELEEDIEFKQLVKDWNREKIVSTLMPILHLSQEGKVTVEQKELFKEIFIKLKKGEKDGEDNQKEKE